MKTKINSFKVSFLTLLLTCLFFILSMVLSSCSLFDSNSEVNKKLLSYMNSSNHLDWISKRTFSLRFDSANENVTGYGTGWIFAKDKNKTDTYYVATNLHVAAFIQNQDVYYEEYSYSKDRYVGRIGSSFSNLSFGIVGSEGSDEFIYGTNNPFGTVDSGLVHYISSVPTTAVKVAFDGSQVFEDKSLIKDPYQIRGKYVENGTIDFALLEIDLSSATRTPINGYSDTIMENFLRQYDENPTKFSKLDGHKSDSNYHIGGFPYDNEFLNPTLPFTKKNPVWLGLTNIDKERDPFYGLALEVLKPAQYNTVLPNQVATNEIPFIKKNKFSSYRNVSLQALIKGVNMGGGSSGSMVVNDDNEVVGIYWGVYTFANRMLMGGIDYFINNQIYLVNILDKDANKKLYPTQTYNLLETVQSKIGDNFVDPVWEIKKPA